MSLLGSETITVNRAVNSYDANGRPQVDSSSSFDTEASVQPLSGNETLQLPEGDREQENLWCYTTVELKADDEVIRDGKKFKVREARNWSAAGFLTHYRSRIISRERQ